MAYLETGFSYVSVAEHKFDVWAFLEPFDNNLWLMIVFTVLMVSIFMYISNYVSHQLLLHSDVWHDRTKKRPLAWRSLYSGSSHNMWSLYFQISPFGYYKQFYKKLPKFAYENACDSNDMKKSIQNILQREFYKIGLDQVKTLYRLFLKALKVQFQGQNSINQIQFSIKSLKYYRVCNEK